MTFDLQEARRRGIILDVSRGILVVDGVDGTGKSSVCKLLHDTYPSPLVVLPEFSESKVGELIRNIIASNRYFRLSDANLGSAELFFMLSDVATKYEMAINEITYEVIMDRGIISAIAYQTVRWEEKYGKVLEEAVVLDLLDCFTSFMPQLTTFTHVNFRIRRETINSRLVNRNEVPLSERGLDTLGRMQDRMMHIGEVLGSSTIDVDELTNEGVVRAVLKIWKPSMGLSLHGTEI